jgi:hypothetical protein
MARGHYEPKVVKDHGTLTNVDTGEVIEAVFEHNIPEPVAQKRFRRSRRVGMSFYMVDKRSAVELELSPNERKVIEELLRVASKEDEGRSSISTSRLAALTGIRDSNVSLVLSALRRRNVVFKEGPGLWRVTPWYAWVGAWEEWDKAAKNYAEPTWKR